MQMHGSTSWVGGIKDGRGAISTASVLLPFLPIQEANYSGTQAGAALLPVPFVLAILSPGTGALAGRFGPRLLLASGSLVVGIGFGMLTRIGERAGYCTNILPALLIISFRLSGAVAPLTTAVLASVDNRHTRPASGLNSAVAHTGGLVVTVLFSAVLAARGGS